MLRTVRSLPSLRLFAQQEAHVVSKAVTATEATTGTLFHYQSESVRNVHSTAKKSTILLDSHNDAKYTTMNLNGLKMECKKRGLKVSGRKMDLVQRLMQNDSSPVEGSRNYNTEVQKLQKPVPPFLNPTGEPKPSKITQELLKSKQSSKMQDEIKKQLRTRIAKEQKDAATLKAITSLKEAALKKDKDSKRQAQEHKAREEISLQAERAQLLEKAASEKKIKDLAEAKKVKAEEQRKLQIQLAEKESQRNIIQTALKGHGRGQIQSKAVVDAEAKSQIVMAARERLKAKVKEEEQKEQQRERENKKENEKEAELSFRDKAFFTGFGVTTATWWYFGNA